MSEAKPTPSEMLTELKVSAHLMLLDAGVYCVSHTPGSTPPDATTGLPGARLSLPPGTGGRGVTISGFNDDGWLGPLDAAALIRVAQGPAHVLMTVYQHPNAEHPAPRLQVTRLVGGAQGIEAVPAVPAQSAPDGAGANSRPGDGVGGAPNPGEAEVAAHVQRRGDVLSRIGDWVGEAGSERWVEGFAIVPRRPGVGAEEIEYQAVLGRGWLSPWAEGGQYCGSRGMALPILGLRVRLRGKAALTHTVTVTATFTDGARVGPVGTGEPCEAESLAPLESFLIELTENAPAPARARAPQAAPAMAAAAPAADKPAARAKPTSEPVAKQAAKPVAKPAAMPVPKPLAKPVAKARGK